MKMFLLFCLLFSFNIYAQKNAIENIVFEGAGIRGIAYAGALETLEQKGLLKNAIRIGGTSAGAVTALLVTLNYSSSEIANIINSTSFKRFNDGRFILFGGLYRLRKWYGWYRGRRFENWLSQLIKQKTGNAEISFVKLQQTTNKLLYITGTSLNKQKLLVFSVENYPHMKVKDAVRISMSIPLYFEAVFIDSTGKIVSHPKNTKGLDVMLDGGFVANFPIKIFDSTKYFTKIDSNFFQLNPHTIGFRIDSDEQIKNDTSTKALVSMPVSNFKEYLGAFYNLILENLNRQSLTEGDWLRTISISDGAIGPRIKKLKKQEVAVLIENGRAATIGYFK